MEERIAIFPGSFDPITLGHFDIITRALPLFDKLIVAIGQNSEKKYMFPIQQRRIWLEETFSDHPKVSVDVYEGLTVDYCKRINSKFILRGLRTPSDFEFEKGIAHLNRDLSDRNIETIFLFTAARKSYVSSSNVREIIRNRGNYELFVPEPVRISQKSLSD